jgi:Asp-tRNA(Asn)/Glu-tRNA(Gln) amidotransferase A subunit family amidase
VRRGVSRTGFAPRPDSVDRASKDADERALRGRVTRLTYPLNVLGWPALAMPAGLTRHGLPASIHLIGRPGADSLVLAAGAALASLD